MTTIMRLLHRTFDRNVGLSLLYLYESIHFLIFVLPLGTYSRIEVVNLSTEIESMIMLNHVIINVSPYIVEGFLY